MEMLFQKLQSWQPTFEANVILFVEALLILFIGWWAINKVSKISLVFFHKTISDAGVTSFFNSLIKFSLRVFLLVEILSFLHFDTTSIITAIGASFVAIGISLKDSLTNIVSGLVLIINKPVHVGDYIEFDGVKGTVIKIEMLFSTLKSSEDGKTIIVPNTKLISSNITRVSDYNLECVEVSYQIPDNLKKDELKKFLEKEILLNQNILQFPKPNIIIDKQENKILVCVKVWCQSQYKKQVESDIKDIKLKFMKKHNIILE